MRVEGAVVFFFNDTATTEIYTLSYTTLFRSGQVVGGRPESPGGDHEVRARGGLSEGADDADPVVPDGGMARSEEHTSELQSTPISRMPSSACKKKITTTQHHSAQPSLTPPSL